MAHDYQLPPEWPSMSSEQRNEWFHQERARRRAKAQDTVDDVELRDAEALDRELRESDDIDVDGYA